MNILLHTIFQKTRFLQKELNYRLKEYNLFASQWAVIYCVHKHKEMTLTDIWRYLNVEAPTITRTVSRLETLGWLTTSQGQDRREKIVRLSEEARAKYSKVRAKVSEFEDHFAGRLTSEEQEELGRLLRKM